MTAGIRTIIYPVRDLARARDLFSRLTGKAPYVDEGYYVAFAVGDQDIGLDPNGHARGMTGPLGYWHVEDIERELKALKAAGGEVVQEVKDVGGGKLIASVRDGEGNLIGLLQAQRAAVG